MSLNWRRLILSRRNLATVCLFLVILIMVMDVFSLVLTGTPGTISSSINGFRQSHKGTPMGSTTDNSMVNDNENAHEFHETQGEAYGADLSPNETTSSIYVHSTTHTEHSSATYTAPHQHESLDNDPFFQGLCTEYFHDLYDFDYSWGIENYASANEDANKVNTRRSVRHIRAYANCFLRNNVSTTRNMTDLESRLFPAFNYVLPEFTRWDGQKVTGRFPTQEDYKAAPKLKKRNQEEHGGAPQSAQANDYSHVRSGENQNQQQETSSEHTPSDHTTNEHHEASIGSGEHQNNQDVHTSSENTPSEQTTDHQHGGEYRENETSAHQSEHKEELSEEELAAKAREQEQREREEARAREEREKEEARLREEREREETRLREERAKAQKLRDEFLANYSYWRDVRDRSNSRGIVFSLSDGSGVAELKNLLQVLRMQGNTYPIQIVHKEDLSAQSMEILIEAARKPFAIPKPLPKQTEPEHLANEHQSGDQNSNDDNYSNGDNHQFDNWDHSNSDSHESESGHKPDSHKSSGEYSSAHSSNEHSGNNHVGNEHSGSEHSSSEHNGSEHSGSEHVSEHSSSEHTSSELQAYEPESEFSGVQEPTEYSHKSTYSSESSSSRHRRFSTSQIQKPDHLEDIVYNPQELWFVNTRPCIRDSAWGLFSHFNNKWLAVLLNSFDEMLMMDTDSVPFISTSELFDLEEYQRHKAYLFRDRAINFLRMQPSEAEYMISLMPSQEESELFHMEPITEFSTMNPMVHPSKLYTHYIESGLILISRSKHIAELLMSMSLQLFAPASAPTYGDKEMFWLGFSVAGSEQYVVNELPAGSIGPLRHFSSVRDDGTPYDYNMTASTQPAHLSKERKLLWVNSGMRNCKLAQNYVADWYQYHEIREEYPDIEDYHNYLLSPVDAEGVLLVDYIPPKTYDEINGNSLLVGFKKCDPKGCTGYTWCAYDHPDYPAEWVEFNEDDRAIIDKVSRYWNADPMFFDFDDNSL